MTDFLFEIIKVVITLVAILLMIYLLAKIGNKATDSSGRSKQIKVLEKVQISKENSIMIVKISQKGYVISSNPKKVEILSEISQEEIENIEEEQKKYREEMMNKYSDVASNLKKKLRNINFKGREK